MKTVEELKETIVSLRADLADKELAFEHWHDEHGKMRRRAEKAEARVAERDTALRELEGMARRVEELEAHLKRTSACVDEDEKRIAELTALLRETQRGFRAEGDPQTELEAPQFVDLMKRVDAALASAEAEKEGGSNMEDGYITPACREFLAHHEAIFEQGRRAERADVVAWLARELHGLFDDGHPERGQVLLHAVVAIRRLDHINATKTDETLP